MGSKCKRDLHQVCFRVSKKEPQPHSTQQPSAQDAEEIVTLRTSKAQEAFVAFRSNFDARHPNTDLPSRRALPDLDPEAALQAPFFSPGPLHTLKLLPSLRPRVFSIHGGGSADPLPEIRELQISSTGVGGGGNGGLFKGGVSVAEVDGGHFMAMKNPRALLMELAQWMEQEHGIWRERWRDREERWVKLPVEEK